MKTARDWPHRRKPPLPFAAFFLSFAFLSSALRFFGALEGSTLKKLSTRPCVLPCGCGGNMSARECEVHQFAEWQRKHTEVGSRKRGEGRGRGIMHRARLDQFGSTIADTILRKAVLRAHEIDKAIDIWCGPLELDLLGRGDIRGQKEGAGLCILPIIGNYSGQGATRLRAVA